MIERADAPIFCQDEDVSERLDLAGERGEDPLSGLVGVENIVSAVDDERRVRFRRPEQQLDRLTHRGHRVRIERRFRVDRRETSCLKKNVAIAQRDIERVRSLSTISRLGLARPVSRQLKCRAETPVIIDSDSWLNPRDERQARSCPPKLLCGRGTESEPTSIMQRRE